MRRVDAEARASAGHYGMYRDRAAMDTVGETKTRKIEPQRH
ncbi:MAG: hypothetical protein V3R25_10385 [Nitrosomonadaceae bacterium]